MRPIDADALLKRRRNFGKDYALDPVDKNIDDQLVDLRDVLNAPTLDYAPVRSGKWIRANEEQVYFDVEYMCSECQFVVAVSGIGTPLLYGYKHCPNCGAKMDGGKIHE